MENIEINKNGLYKVIPMSRLYSLKPIGIHTSQVESLTNYIMRLAMAHSVTVGTLVKYEIIPRLKMKYYMIDGRTAFYNQLKRLNSSSMLSREVIKVLMELTGNDDLRYLQFGFSDFFSKGRVFKDNRSWCPYCLEDMKSKGRIIYEPLIWNFSIVEFCKKHMCKLQTICPICGQEMIFTPKSIPGYCSRCHSWLGDLNNYGRILILEKDQWHCWVYKNIAELISEETGNQESIDGKVFAKNLRKIANHFSGNLKKFAQQVNVNYSTIGSWVVYDKRPNLNLMIGLSYCVGIKVKHMVTEQLFLDDPKITLRQPVKEIPPIRITTQFDLCEQILNSSILDSFPPTIFEIAKRAMVHHETLRRNFPEEVRNITAKRKEFIRKKRLLEEYKEQNEIKKTVIKLYRRGKYPTRFAVRNELGSSWLFNKQSNYVTWKKAVLALVLKTNSKELNDL